MKTINTILRVLLLSTIALPVFATNGKPSFIRISDVSFNSVVSGNGFGMQYQPTLGIGLGNRFVVYGGPSYCAKTWHYTGLTAGTRYYFLKEDDSNGGHARLFATARMTRHNNEGLSRSFIEREAMTSEQMQNGDHAPFCELRYRGWEYSAGVGVSYRFNCGLLIRTGIALSYYDTEKENYCSVNTYRSDRDLVLRISTGLGWSFGGRSISAGK